MDAGVEKSKVKTKDLEKCCWHQELQFEAFALVSGLLPVVIGEFTGGVLPRIDQPSTTPSASQQYQQGESTITS